MIFQAKTQAVIFLLNRPPGEHQREGGLHPRHRGFPPGKFDSIMGSTQGHHFEVTMPPGQPNTLNEQMEHPV